MIFFLPFLALFTVFPFSSAFIRHAFFLLDNFLLIF